MRSVPASHNVIQRLPPAGPLRAGQALLQIFRRFLAILFAVQHAKRHVENGIRHARILRFGHRRRAWHRLCENIAELRQLRRDSPHILICIERDAGRRVAEHFETRDLRIVIA